MRLQVEFAESEQRLKVDFNEKQLVRDVLLIADVDYTEPNTLLAEVLEGEAVENNVLDLERIKQLSPILTDINKELTNGEIEPVENYNSVPKAIAEINAKNTESIDLFSYIGQIAFSPTISEVTNLPNIIDLSNATNLLGFLNYININFEYIGLKLSICTSLQNSFRTNTNYIDNLKEIEIIGNTSAVTTFLNAFNGRRALKKITGELNFTSATNTANTFLGCNNLTQVTAAGTIHIGIDLKYSNIDAESAKSFAICLENYAGTDKDHVYSILFSAKTWEYLDAEGNNSPNGTSWRDYINSKGWEI